VDFAGHASGAVTLRDLETVPIERRAETRIRDVIHNHRRQPLVLPRDASLSDNLIALHRHGGAAVVVDAITGHPVGVIADVTSTR
jgi:CBS domain-containing protein